MKRLKINKMLFGMILFSIIMLVYILTIDAATGSATLGYTGSTTAEVGKNITVNVVVKDVVGDPIGGAVALVKFDSSYLRLVSSSTNPSAPFQPTLNTNTMIFSGFTQGQTGITSTTTIVSLVLTPLKEGSVTLTLEDLDLTDIFAESPNAKAESHTINIGPAKSTNSYLASFTVAGHTLTPAFNKNTNNYTLNVSNDVTSVNVSAACEDAKATLSWQSGHAGVNNLNVGDNRITARCTSESGEGRNYILTVKRAAPAQVLSDDATLSALNVDGYTISPAFSSSVTSYSVNVPFEATSVKVNATKNHNKANVVIKGMDNLQVGNNVITVEVTAENGAKKSYTINVTREEKQENPPELDKDSTLKGLTVNTGTLSPAFNSNNSTYTLEVSDSVNSIDVNAIPNSDKAKVEISGNTNLKTGFNAVEVTVTAEDGTKSKYIINVYKKEKQTSTTVTPKKESNNNYLSSLTVDGATLSPKFNKDVVSYNVTIPYDVSKLDIKYVVEDKKSKVEILENEPLKVGEVKQVYVKVTAEDGSVRMYTINATRSALSSNAYLKELSVNGFNLNQSFEKTKLNYSVNVDANTKSLDLKALAENDKAKVEILGNSNLKVGSNMLMVSVTDENGFSKIYQLDVIKPEATIFGLSRAMFFTLLAFALGLLGLILLLAFILSRRKKEEPVVAADTPTTTIDFKPEFNFGSKNGTDDDVVYPGGILNQGNGSMDKLPGNEPKKLVGTYSDAEYSDSEEKVPFDFYDDTITKDELIAAIKEGMDTKNSDKLKMLLKQEELNKMKKEIKNREER